MGMLGELTISGKTYELDDLSLGELSELEDHMGLPVTQIDLNSARAMQFIVWLVRRRELPGFTLEQAGEVKVTDLIPETPDDANPPADAGAEDAPASEPTAG